MKLLAPKFQKGNTGRKKIFGETAGGQFASTSKLERRRTEIRRHSEMQSNDG
jgi:hypothetical protein